MSLWQREPDVPREYSTIPLPLHTQIGSAHGACRHYTAVLHDTRIAFWHIAHRHIALGSITSTPQHAIMFLSRSTGYSFP